MVCSLPQVTVPPQRLSWFHTESWEGTTPSTSSSNITNHLYMDLGDRWYHTRQNAKPASHTYKDSLKTLHLLSLRYQRYVANMWISAG